MDLRPDVLDVLALRIAEESRYLEAAFYERQAMRPRVGEVRSAADRLRGMLEAYAIVVAQDPNPSSDDRDHAVGERFALALEMIDAAGRYRSRD